MRRHLMTFLKLTLLLAAAVTASGAHAAPRGWEPVKSERADSKVVARETDVEIRAANGMIIVSTNHPAQIRIFTILGREVNSEILPAGRSQLVLPAHGVYIVKVGALTCKVAV